MLTEEPLPVAMCRYCGVEHLFGSKYLISALDLARAYGLRRRSIYSMLSRQRKRPEKATLPWPVERPGQPRWRSCEAMALLQSRFPVARVAGAERRE